MLKYTKRVENYKINMAMFVKHKSGETIPAKLSCLLSYIKVMIKVNLKTMQTEYIEDKKVRNILV